MSGQDVIVIGGGTGEHTFTKREARDIAAAMEKV